MGNNVAKKMKGVMIVVVSIAALACSAYANQCGEMNNPCKIEGGEYYIKLPHNKEGDIPVVMFLHGAGGTGKTTMGNKNLVEGVLGRGYAFIAPTGGPRPGSRFKNLWNFLETFQNMRDDQKFLTSVIEDAKQQFGVSTNVLLSGFSAGAFMVTYLACDKPNAFTAYAPVAGGFWLPHPQKCEGAVKLLQTHGWKDKTVPLEGRSLGGGQYHQGDIFAGLQIWRQANQCKANPKVSVTGEDYWRRKWDCSEGALELIMHDGSHGLPKGWADEAIDWFEEVSSVN